MSSKRRNKSISSCPGCHLPKAEHDFGMLHKNCNGPDSNSEGSLAEFVTAAPSSLLMAANLDQYTELAHYRGIIQKANRKFQWTTVDDYDVQFRMSLSENATAGRLDIVGTTLYTSILDSSAVHKDGLCCQRCKSAPHLVQDCSFCPKSSLEENKK